MSANHADTAPLEGLRVLDLGMFIAGPCAAHDLACLGADVIKVELPSGDPFRTFSTEGLSSQFQAYNVGKRSIALDYLKSSEDREMLKSLISRSDVLIENFRPGVLASVGLGFADCKELSDRLVFCSISGFGQTGPSAEQPCFDTVGQAGSGFLKQMLDPSKPMLTGPAIADAVTGHYAAQAVLAACIKRASRPGSIHVDVAMIDAMLHFCIEPIASYYEHGETPGCRDRAALSQAYILPCSDDEMVALHLSSREKFWDALCLTIQEVLDCSPEAAGLDGFASRETRVQKHAALEDKLQSLFRQRPRKVWIPALEQNDVPHAPILDFESALSSDQSIHRNAVQEIEASPGARYKTISGPWRFNGSPISHRLSPPPTLNEHREEIMSLIEDC